MSLTQLTYLICDTQGRACEGLPIDHEGNYSMPERWRMGHYPEARAIKEGWTVTPTGFLECPNCTEYPLLADAPIGSTATNKRTGLIWTKGRNGKWMRPGGGGYMYDESNEGMVGYGYVVEAAL